MRKFLILISTILTFIFYSCSTGVPTLSPSVSTNKLLSISLFLKDTIRPTINYEYNSQNYNYYFYATLFFRFDDNLLSNNLDLVDHIFYFENGFKRINRVNPPSSDTSINDEWSNIIIDNNSQIIGNELRFNIPIPDNLIGNKNFFKFIVLIFLRDFEYSVIADNFGQNPVSYFNNPSFPITINLTNIQTNTVYSINNPVVDTLVDSNLPPGFPDNYKNSLKIQRIEYIYRVF